MLLAVSAFKGYVIEASDGSVGTVSDLLFDDRNWNARWLVVSTGSWLSGSKMLIHPSAVGLADYELKQLPVRLTKEQIADNRGILDIQPVSKQLENHLYHHHESNPLSAPENSSGTDSDQTGFPLSPPHAMASAAVGEAAEIESRLNDGDPHLRSTAAVTGYHIQTSDGEIGHVADVLFDDVKWDIRYLIINTQNWWFGKHVLVAPFAVREIRWSDKHIRLDISCDRIRSSPPWEPEEIIDQAYEERLHSHYGWRGYGGDSVQKSTKFAPAGHS